MPYILVPSEMNETQRAELAKKCAELTLDQRRELHGLSPLPPTLIAKELRYAVEMVEAGVEPDLQAAVETCINHSGEGPFNPREQEWLRAAAVEMARIL